MTAIALGVLVGLVLGLTGAGGSILAVPLLMWGVGWALPQAVPVALLAVCAATTFGTIVAWNVRLVRYRAASLMAGMGLLAAPIGLEAALWLPLQALTLLFAAVLAIVALRMFRQAQRAPQDTAVVRAALVKESHRAADPICKLNPSTGRLMWTRPCAVFLAAAGAFTGLLAGLLGVGGGFVIVPALRFATDLSMHSAVATSLMAIALTSGGTVAISAMQGHAMPWLIAVPFAAGTLAGMSAGRLLAPRIAGPHLQRGFAAVMSAVALGMFVHAFRYV